MAATRRATCLGGGGARKDCILLDHEKTTLPIQDIFGDNLYIWGHSFNLGHFFVGKIFNFISGSNFLGQIFV